MTSHHQDSFRWQFDRLIELAEQGDRPGADSLFEKLLSHGAGELFDPLANYLITQPNHPRIATLLELLAKLGDMRATPILVRFLDIEVRELRIRAAVGLGWLRPRAALERLDVAEGLDPDEDVRREARVAVSEILREFPNLRSLCKHHVPFPDTAVPIIQDGDETIARTTAPGGEERQRLVAFLPRLLALKHKAVPLGVGMGGVLGVAVRRDQDPSIAGQMRRLTGHEVSLHGWPLEKIYERLLTFYAWGDEDWVHFSENVTRDALAEISDIVLRGILPEEPHPPLEDCFDVVEAIQSFLSICALGDYASATLDLRPSSHALNIALVPRDGGERRVLAPPDESVWRLFLKALGLLAFLDASGRGLIRHEHPGLARPFAALVIRTVGERGAESLALDFLHPEAN